MTTRPRVALYLQWPGKPIKDYALHAPHTAGVLVTLLLTLRDDIHEAARLKLLPGLAGTDKQTF